MASGKNLVSPSWNILSNVSKAFSDMFRGLVMCLRFSMIYLEGLGL